MNALDQEFKHGKLKNWSIEKSKKLLETPYEKQNEFLNIYTKPQKTYKEIIRISKNTGLFLEKNLAKYPLGSFLPGEYQKKIGKTLDINPLKLTATSLFVDTSGNMAQFIYGLGAFTEIEDLSLRNILKKGLETGLLINSIRGLGFCSIRAGLLYKKIPNATVYVEGPKKLIIDPILKLFKK